MFESYLKFKAEGKGNNKFVRKKDNDKCDS